MHTLYQNVQNTKAIYFGCPTQVNLANWINAVKAYEAATKENWR